MNYDIGGYDMGMGSDLGVYLNLDEHVEAERVRRQHEKRVQFDKGKAIIERLGAVEPGLVTKILGLTTNRDKEQRAIQQLKWLTDPEELWSDLTAPEWGLRLPDDFVFPESPTDEDFEKVYMGSVLGDIQREANLAGGEGEHEYSHYTITQALRLSGGVEGTNISTTGDLY